ncbi:unnamed protein product [Prorocentrum cordatum]|uniref:Uncharacterized protein n=1 Tax=Prorocentrum cordatum TaxID=2364126 RepID=A0ABN9QCU2_9DINO|nr:unnamed protein product [Polarella glacialis]
MAGSPWQMGGLPHGLSFGPQNGFGPLPRRSSVGDMQLASGPFAQTSFGQPPGGGGYMRGSNWGDDHMQGARPRANSADSVRSGHSQGSTHTPRGDSKEMLWSAQGGPPRGPPIRLVLLAVIIGVSVLAVVVLSVMVLHILGRRHGEVPAEPQVIGVGPPAQGEPSLWYQAGHIEGFDCAAASKPVQGARGSSDASFTGAIVTIIILRGVVIAFILAEPARSESAERPVLLIRVVKDLAWMALMWQPMLRHKVAQPIGASSQKASYDKKADKRTSTEQDATTLQHEFGSYAFREWEGEKGETYHIEASGEATPWTCTLLEKNGHSKKFKVYPDEASGKIWWGQGWTFFCNLRAEEAHQTLALSWYRPGARTPSFVWWAQPEAPAGPGRAAEDGARPARAAPPGGRAAAGLPRWRPKPAAAPRPEAEGAGGAPSAGPGGGAAEGPAEGGGGAGGGGEAARGAPPEPGGGAAAVAGPPEPVGAGCGSQARSIANLREQLEEEERRQAK